MTLKKAPRSVACLIVAHHHQYRALLGVGLLSVAEERPLLALGWSVSRKLIRQKQAISLPKAMPVVVIWTVVVPFNVEYPGTIVGINFAANSLAICHCMQQNRALTVSVTVFP